VLCNYCKKEFEPKNNQQKYCSQFCRYEQAKIRQREDLKNKRLKKEKEEKNFKKYNTKKKSLEPGIETPSVLDKNNKINPYYLHRNLK
jgi:hypothetical protein